MSEKLCQQCLTEDGKYVEGVECIRVAVYPDGTEHYEWVCENCHPGNEPDGVTYVPGFGHIEL
jgi:hypothetical protein